MNPYEVVVEEVEKRAADDLVVYAEKLYYKQQGEAIKYQHTLMTFKKLRKQVSLVIPPFATVTLVFQVFPKESKNVEGAIDFRV